MDLIGATYVRDVEPGEVLVDQRRRRPLDQAVPAGAARALRLRARLLRAARQLRVRHERQRGADQPRPHARARAARSTPTSSCRCPTRASARRWATPTKSGIPLRMGLIRNHYVGRTFIQPQSSIRHFGVKVKLNPVRSILEGKRVVLVDDSIVRGTTSRKIVKMVRAAGAQRGARANQLPADDLAVLLRRRHAAPLGADRRDAHARRDSRLPRGRQRRLPEPRRADDARSATANAATARSCYTGTIRCAFPRDEKTLPAARAEARRQGTPVGQVMSMHATSRVLDRVPAGCPLRPRSRALGGDARSGARNPPRPQAVSRRSSCRPRSTSSAISTTPPAPPPRARSAAPPARRRCRRCCRPSPSSRRLRPLSRARPAHRLQRSADEGRHARVADEPERSPADGRLQLLRAQSRSARWLAELLAALDKEQAEFVRPALVRALAAHGATTRGSSRSLRPRGRPRRGFLPQRRHRGARRLQGALRLRRARRGREARRPAAGRCGAGAREDRRQARARDAGRRCSGPRRGRRSRSIAAAICLLGVNCESHENYLDRDAEVRRSRTPASRNCCAARRPASARSASPGHDEAVDALFEVGIPSRRSDARAGGAGARRRSRCATRR